MTHTNAFRCSCIQGRLRPSIRTPLPEGHADPKQAAAHLDNPAFYCRDHVLCAFREGLSVEVALGIVVGLDMALAAASLAFMARRLSTDIVQWGAQKLQPGRKTLERLQGRQVHCPALFWDCESQWHACQ